MKRRHPHDRVKQFLHGVNIAGLPTWLNIGEILPIIPSDALGVWVYDYMDYLAAAALDTQAGGLGWASNWTTVDGPIIGALNLCTIGDSVDLLGTGNHASSDATILNPISQRDIDTTALPDEYITNIAGADHIWADGLSVYFSYTFESSLAHGPWRLELRRSDDTIAFSFGTDDALVAAPNLFDYIDPDTQLAVDLGALPDIIPDQAYFVVVEFNFGVAMDTTNVYINPTLLTKPVVPTFTYDTATQTTRIHDLNAFALAGGGVFKFDEIRLGGTYASVTPPDGITLLTEDSFAILTESGIRILV